MSTWYDVSITAYGHEASLSKLLNLKEEDIHGLNQIELSFGKKNGPALDLKNLVKNNPDLVFLIETVVECFSGNVWLAHYDRSSESFQDILLESFNYDTRQFNKNIIKDYPELLSEFKETDNIRWKNFLYDYSKSLELLSRAHQYPELSDLIVNQDLEFDNAPLDEE